jgi:hypothetical protein
MKKPREESRGHLTINLKLISLLGSNRWFQLQDMDLFQRIGSAKVVFIGKYLLLL